jgi:hypothetical protein
VREKPAKYSANSPTLTLDGSIRPGVREKPARYSANSPTLLLAPSATPSPAPTEAQIATSTALSPTTRPAPRRDSRSSFATPSY